MSPILAILGIVYSLYFAMTHPATSFHGYLDVPSLVLLGMMPPSVILLSHTLKDLTVGIGILLKALFRTQGRAEREVIDVLTKSSALVRSEGIGALMKFRSQVRYPLLRDGLSLILNDFTPEEIRHNLQNRLNTQQLRMSLAANLFENLSRLAPSVGLMGTVMGLISMMANLKNPEQIGGGMAMAMITTFYGLILGNIIYAPCSEKITLESEKSLQIDMMVLEGILTLKGKKSSIHMRDIMSTYTQRSDAKGALASTPAGKK
ncbi:MAG: MotA/TolQ/ExbB proton channel family protein [Proteobacteria bacterium]|nr:MotA/TolQ/ExbB proton channel family protein [Pseudomonadota bacterium]